MGSVISLFKIPSKKLKEKNFNLDIKRKKANVLGYVIALGESQVIDWLYEERGYSSFKEVEDKVKEIKKEINEVKNNKELTKDERTKTVEKKLQEIDDLLFAHELLQVDYGSRKELDTVMKKHNGIITVNGIRYKYLVSKGSSTLTYIQEDLYEKISTRLNAGRNVEIPLQPAKLSAYKSLAFTNSEQVTAPNNVIVIKDCKVQFEETYLKVGETEEKIEKKTDIVKRNICDGCGFISPELGEQWSRDLRKEEKVVSAFQVRNLWTKGILVPVDFKTYCIEHDTYTITDVWGHERNILNADIILTESMVKVHKGYKSMEDWLKSSHDYGYSWRVGKVAKSDKFGNSNYQQLLPMSLTEEDCREFIQPQIELMKNITGKDTTATFTSLYLNGTNHTERSIKRMFDTSQDVEYTLSSALMIEPKLLTDKFVARKIQANLQGQRNEMKYGHCMVESNYQIITCDPIQLLEHMCGVENPKGVLKKGEIYSKKHMTQGITECIAFRAPMLIENNIVKVNIPQIDEEYTHYFEYLDNVYCVNGNDLMNESLCGLK